MEQRAHSNLSPSKRHRWALCPASVREEAKFPESRSGKAAIDGTHTHTLLDTCLKAKTFNASQYIGQTLKDEDGEFVVDDARAERTNFALDYIQQRATDLGDCQIISEDRVDPFPIIGRFDLAGHVDVQIVTRDYLEIIDYKDGVSLVNAEGNLQLEQYAFGCLCAHQDKNFKTIRMTIIQPKLRDVGLMGISYSEVSFDYLMSRKDLLAAQAAATDDPNAPFNPGEEQCQYCRAKGSCGALTGQIMEKSGIQFHDLTKMEGREVTSMTDDQIALVVINAKHIRDWIEGVEEEAQRRLEAGQAIDGLKLVRGRGTRAWAFSDEEMAAKLKKFGIPKEALWETKLISPAKAEKLRWKKGDEEKRLSDKQMSLMEAEYITKSDGNLCVAPLTDKRPAVELVVANMFSAIDDFSDLPDFLKPRS